MCGIAGTFSFDDRHHTSASLISRMCAQIQHRGPDDEGIYVNGRIGLGVRRLSIIDLPGGHQPIPNEDKSVWVIFNGEIYNFKQLREDLERIGHEFVTNSDTETVVHAYESDGVDCVNKLRGMFALAIWDEKQERLFLARDRLGKKPLYYTIQNGALRFASELMSLLHDQATRPAINLEALDLYLTFQYVPSPLTMFEGIYKLPPATFLRCDKSGVALKRYWAPDDSHQPYHDQQEYCDRLVSLLKESVRLRMLSDVPLGAFLSGGIDSSVIVALMAERSAAPIKTFSIGFREEQFSELPYARRVAKHFGTDHQELVVTPDILRIIPTLVRHYGEPFGDSSAVPTYYLSEMTRRSVTVALSGDGGDELFAGYTKYPLFERLISAPRAISRARHLINRALRILGPPPPLAHDAGARLRRALNARTLSPEDRNFHWATTCDDSFKRRLYLPDIRQAVAPRPAADFHRGQLNGSHQSDAISRVLFADIVGYLPDDLLVKLDIASMANSLEVRCPFLDHELVEFSLSIPWTYKLRNGHTKLLLKHAFRNVLPPDILARPKVGFAVPIDHWLRTHLRSYTSDTLLDSIGIKRFFDLTFVERLLRSHNAGIDHGAKLWLLLNFALWHHAFME